MDQGSSRVVSINDRSRRAHRELARLLAEAQAELVAVRGGEVVAIYDLHRVVNQALGVVLKHELDLPEMAS